MKASYQGDASWSAPVWFLHVLRLMCVMFSTISSSSGGQPEARQVMVWGSPGHLWPTTWKKSSHTWYEDIYLVTYGFWKERNRLCRVTPIELWEEYIFCMLIKSISIGIFQIPLVLAIPPPTHSYYARHSCQSSLEHSSPLSLHIACVLQFPFH